MFRFSLSMKHSAKTLSACDERGFSLVELAVVLIIVGLLLSTLIPPLTAQLDQRSYKTTTQQIDEAREAMITFAIVNGRLPRPASSIDDGAERGSDCTTEAECTGFIPWATLGVKRTDAWDRMLRYSVSPSYANTTAFTLTTVGTKKVMTRNAAGATSYLIGGSGSCSTSSPCAPAVIYSHGKNNWGISADGIAHPDASTTNADEDVNEAATNVFFARDQGNAPTGGEFDDIVTWISPYVLFGKMIAARNLP